MSQITLTQEPSRKRKMSRQGSYSSKRSRGGRRSFNPKRVLSHGDEKHFHDTYNATAFDQNPIVTYLDLAAIPQGDTDLTRSGDKVTLASMQLRFKLLPSTSTVANNGFDQTVRLVLFQWIPDDNVDTPATSNAVFQDVSTYQRALQTAYNHDSGYKFKILRDKRYVLEHHLATATAVAGITDAVVQPQIMDFWMVMPKEYKTRQCRFNAAGTTGSGKIYMALITDAANANGLDHQMYCRLNFYG